MTQHNSVKLYSDLLVGMVLGVAVLVLWAGWRGSAAYVVGLVAVPLLFYPLLVLSNRYQSFPFIAFGIYSLLVIPWAVFVNSNQVSDFGVYFRCGSDYVQSWTSFADWTRQCESQWLPGFATYWRRSFLYTLLIGYGAKYTVGDFYLVLKLVNAFLHLCTIAILYKGVKQELGKSAALISAILLATYPEFWFVTTIASSDNLAVLALVVFGFLLAKLARQELSLIRILLIVFLIVVLDFLRSIGPILVVATLMTIPLAKKRARLSVIIAAVSAALLVVFLGALPTVFELSTKQSNGLLATLVGTGISHHNSFLSTYAWHQYALPLINPEQRNQLMYGLLANDYHSMLPLMSFWFHKLVTLFDGIGYFYFSTVSMGNNPDDVAISGALSSFNSMEFLYHVLRGITIMACIAAAVGALMGRSPAGVRTAVVIICAFLLFFLLVGEVQPRYSVLIAPALSVAAAGLVGWRRSAKYQLLQTGIRNIVVIAICTLLVVKVVNVWAKSYLVDAPKLVLNEHSSVFPECSSTGFLKVKQYGTLIALNGQQCSAFSANVDAQSGEITFILLRDPVAPKWSKELRDEIDIEILAHSQTGVIHKVDQRLLPSEQAVRVTMPPATQYDIALRAKGDKSGKTDNRISMDYFYNISSALIVK